VRSLHVLPVCVDSHRVRENLHVRLTGDSKLILGVSVTVHGCVSLCGPAMDWRHVQGEPRLSPNDSWDRLLTKGSH